MDTGSRAQNYTLKAHDKTDTTIFCRICGKIGSKIDRHRLILVMTILWVDD